MKRSKLYNNLIRAYRAEIGRIERRLETIKKHSQRAVGRYKKELDEERDLLLIKLDLLKADMTKAYRTRDRAKQGELYWENVEKNRIPAGYQHP